MNPNLGLSRLSWDERIRRSYYVAVETLLDRLLIEHVLLDSLERFKADGTAYPFIKTAELKPGGIAPTTEHGLHNSALILFIEHEFPADLKPYIRVRKKNELLSRNLQFFSLPDAHGSDGLSAFREICAPPQLDGVRQLLNLDMALVIQRRNDRKAGLCYEFTHFHVMIDAVLDAIIEDYGIELRYLSRNLYERGEEYAALLEQKFFEQFGMKTTASGRRTAALVAHRLLARRLPGLHVVYCGSTESRCLYKIHSDGTLSRVVLVPVDDEAVGELTDLHDMSARELEKHYLVDAGHGNRAAIFYVRNNKTPPALPPSDRKLRREISVLERWISTDIQLLLPLPSSTAARPLEWNWIYRSASSKTNED